MSLIDLWNTARDSIRDKHVQQIISFAGNGKLSDGNETSKEFRSFLSYVPSDFLIRYASECLNTAFDQSGYALQDIINQIGRRLSFDVVDGLYKGKKDVIGFDGIWKSGENDIVVEVKTTDTYRIDLNVLAGYRNALIKSNRISDKKSSILIVVGRQDTGDLEAQIRGSRHAWDIRLISVDSLIRLMQLKETVEDVNIVTKICSILTPQEFTKVDGIIDIVFSTAEDLNLGSGSATAVEDDKEIETEVQPADKTPPVNFYDQCIARISEKLKVSLTKQSRTTYRTPHNELAVSCSISKEYVRQNRTWYWFAFHPAQKDQLEKASKAFAAFGCGSEQIIFLIPLSELLSWLPGLNKTLKEKRYYWHIHITTSNGRWILTRKADQQDIDITGYLI